jgi:hypothetical protein
METRNEPASRQDSGTKRLAQRPLPESSANDTAGRGSVPTDRHDEEEKEAGYGHGV